MAVAEPEVATSDPSTLQLLAAVTLDNARRVATVVLSDDDKKKENKNHKKKQNESMFHTQETMQRLNCGCDFRLFFLLRDVLDCGTESPFVPQYGNKYVQNMFLIL